MSCYKFFRRQDQLGSTVNLNYKGEAAYGTFVGGCCSTIATLFFAFFTIVQLMGFFLEP